jgi:hypothetical protein
MREIVPPGYAISPQELKRITDELRQARAAELTAASEQDRARIEKEISEQARRKIEKPCGRGRFWHLIH